MSLDNQLIQTKLGLFYFANVELIYFADSDGFLMTMPKVEWCFMILLCCNLF